MGQQQGVEFDQPLVDDANGSFCTRSRVSPYTLAAVGMHVPNLQADYYAKSEYTLPTDSVPAFYTTESWKAA